jgi:hypothetical protein
MIREEPMSLLASSLTNHAEPDHVLHYPLIAKHLPNPSKRFSKRQFA